MKKIGRIIACLFVFCTAVIAQPSAMDLYFTSLKIDQGKMAEYCLNMDKQYEAIWGNELSGFYCESDNDGIRAASLLDTTVEIHFYGNALEQFLDIVRWTQNCVGPYPQDSTVGTPGTHQFSEVFEAEMMRFQENGVIALSKDSLKSVVDKAVEVAVGKNLRCVDMDVSSYDESNGGGGSLFGIGCCSLVDSSRMFLPLVKFNSIGARATKIGKNEFHLQGVKSDDAYTLFDLNGSVLQQGWVRSGIIQTPMLPAILRIQEKTIMLK